MLLHLVIALNIGVLFSSDVPSKSKTNSPIIHAQKKASKQAAYIYHKARPNQGLWQIAAAHKVTKNVYQWIETVAQINDLRVLDSEGNYVITTDQVIKMPSTWQ